MHVSENTQVPSECVSKGKWPQIVFVTLLSYKKISSKMSSAL